MVGSSSKAPHQLSAGGRVVHSRRLCGDVSSQREAVAASTVAPVLILSRRIGGVFRPPHDRKPLRPLHRSVF